jgi:predicted molibdopterin-dependent oxidoreductase YjgC
MEMVDAACEGKLAALYIMGENPLLVFPQKERVKEALDKLDFLVVQDIFLTETAQMADVVLPAASFAEKSGTFTSTERRVQKINPAIKPIGQSKPDAEILQAVAEAMGASLNYYSPARVMEEISQVVPIYANISYQRLGDKGLQWPVEADGEDTGFLMDLAKPFAFHALDYTPPKKDTKFPYLLLSGGLLFHHGSGTMTSKTRGLPYLCPQAELEINPADAQRLKVQDGDKVVIDNCCGSLTAKVKLSERYPAGIVFLPRHFSSTPVNLIVGQTRNKLTQTPASKITRVKIKRLDT